MRSRSALQLKVIEGGGAARPQLLRLPPAILGPSIFNRDSLIGYRVAEQDLRKALENRRRQPALDLWSMVIGKLPPVPNASKYEEYETHLAAQSLAKAHAAFRGVKRPVGDDARGFDHVVFITKPSVHFRYIPDMVCVLTPERVPDDVVLATYVKLDFPEGRPTSLRADVPVGGIITHWELVERDGLVPVHSKERYRLQLW